MKKLAVLICTAIIAVFALGITEAEAAKTDTEWNYNKEIKKTVGAFTYKGIISKDKKEVWIYEIAVNKKKKHSKLSIPKKIGNRKVTRIGYTVEIIQPTTFSGANYITSIKIPKKVKVLEEETFLGCDRLKTIYLPTGLKELDARALEDCPKLKTLKLSSKNKPTKSKANM